MRWPAFWRSWGFRKIKREKYIAGMVETSRLKLLAIRGAIFFDGSEIRQSAGGMVNICKHPMIYRVLAPSQVVGNGISQPSTVVGSNHVDWVPNIPRWCRTTTNCGSSSSNNNSSSSNNNSSSSNSSSNNDSSNNNSSSSNNNSSSSSRNSAFNLNLKMKIATSP